RTLRSAAPPRRAPPAHFPPAEPPLPLRKSRNAPRSHLWPPPSPLRSAPRERRQVSPAPARPSPRHPHPSPGQAGERRCCHRAWGRAPAGPLCGCPPGRAEQGRSLPVRPGRAVPGSATCRQRFRASAKCEGTARPGLSDARTPRVAAPGSAQTRAAPDETPGQWERGRSANAAREERNERGERRCCRPGARGSLRGAAERGNSTRHLGLAKNCDPSQLFTVSAVLKTRAKESLVVCVGVYKWFRIGKKKMSGRRVAAACDRRQLPRGMGSMAAPLLDPRPLRLPFLEADVSRTRGGEGLCWGRGRARSAGQQRQPLHSQPVHVAVFGIRGLAEAALRSFAAATQKKPRAPPAPRGGRARAAPPPAIPPRARLCGLRQGPAAPGTGNASGERDPRKGERGMDPRDPRNGSNGESDPRDPWKGEWGTGPPEGGGMARRDPRKGEEWGEGPPGPPKGKRGEGPRDPQQGGNEERDPRSGIGDRDP
ncbi:hypothetical protein Nmel_015169, partial [Mimus melanotis]